MVKNQIIKFVLLLSVFFIQSSLPSFSMEEDKDIEARIRLKKQKEPHKSAKIKTDVITDPVIKAVIPEIVRGYEDIYERFLKGVLVYRPTEGSDVGKIELPIAALTNPLESTFDLSSCGDTGQRLSIATGYRKGQISSNANKTEVWISPRFLIEKNLEGSASHFKDIMGAWDAKKAPVGLFFTWGGYDTLSRYDYITTQDYDILSSENLYTKWRLSKSHKTSSTKPSESKYVGCPTKNFMFIFNNNTPTLFIKQAQQEHICPITMGVMTDPVIKAVIPEIVHGYEDIYERFLKGVLVYKPNKDSDEGRVEMRIADLANPLEGTFDLYKCGKASKYLSISTGYRKGKRPENGTKSEVWISPRFLIEKNLEGSASHFKDIMGTWDPGTSSVGTFLTWGCWDDLSWYDYTTSISWNEYNENNLYKIRHTSVASPRVLFARSRMQRHDLRINNNPLRKTELYMSFFNFSFPGVPAKKPSESAERLNYNGQTTRKTSSENDSLYKQGEKFERDFGIGSNIAKSYYLEAAENLHDMAILKLGHIAWRDEDFTSAFEWFTKAEKQNNNKYAQCFLGLCYYFGQGVKMSKNKAMEYWKLAADQGEYFSQYNLVAYSTIDSVTKKQYAQTIYKHVYPFIQQLETSDEQSETAESLRISFQNSGIKDDYFGIDIEYCILIGVMHYFGVGTERHSIQKANVWFKRANKLGNKRKIINSMCILI